MRCRRIHRSPALRSRPAVARWPRPGRYSTRGHTAIRCGGARRWPNPCAERSCGMAAIGAGAGPGGEALTHNAAAAKLFNILVHTTSCRHFLVLPDPSSPHERGSSATLNRETRPRVSGPFGGRLRCGSSQSVTTGTPTTGPDPLGISLIAVCRRTSSALATTSASPTPPRESASLPLATQSTAPNGSGRVPAAPAPGATTQRPRMDPSSGTRIGYWRNRRERNGRRGDVRRSSVGRR